MILPKLHKFTKTLIKSLPENPGVYLFWGNSKKRPIYIGKAKNLKSRVASYKSSTLIGKTSAMVSEAIKLSYIIVNSELEALLLEAKLIKKFQPPYNAELKDDKHPLYIMITNEEFPRVITARKKDETIKSLLFTGPFPSSMAVKNVLKILRRAFPYAEHKVSKRSCFYSHINLCNPCPSNIDKLDENERDIQKKAYRNNIRLIKGILSGRIVWVKRHLEKKMTQFSDQEMYEEAKKIREKIEYLDYITQTIVPIDNYLKNPNFIEDVRSEELSALSKILIKNGVGIDKLNRIECFDVAHLNGTNPTASMVVFTDGENDKAEYRKFGILQKKKNSDFDSMVEVITRRLKHLGDWGRPDLIMVDGGKPQVSAFIKAIGKEGIPVVGLAKRQETLVIPLEGMKYNQVKVPHGPARNLVQRLRDEAHRFARSYHHKLVQKHLLESK